MIWNNWKLLCNILAVHGGYIIVLHIGIIGHSWWSFLYGWNWYLFGGYQITQRNNNISLLLCVHGKYWKCSLLILLICWLACFNHTGLWRCEFNINKQPIQITYCELLTSVLEVLNLKPPLVEFLIALCSVLYAFILSPDVSSFWNWHQCWKYWTWSHQWWNFLLPYVVYCMRSY